MVSDALLELNLIQAGTAEGYQLPERVFKAAMDSGGRSNFTDWSAEEIQTSWQPKQIITRTEVPPD